jgi:hypothetical protein
MTRRRMLDDPAPARGALPGLKHAAATKRLRLSTESRFVLRRPQRVN